MTRNDPLPKTVCPNCVDRLEKHFRMVQMITKAESKFNYHKDKSYEDGSSKQSSFREEGDETSDHNEDSDYEDNLLHMNKREKKNNML